MAVDDLDQLRKGLPGLFHDLPMPVGWDQWIVVPVGDPESPNLDDLEGSRHWPPGEAVVGRRQWADKVDDWPDFVIPTEAIDGAWAGAPSQRPLGDPPPPPPPDALAFYLPFHYFHPVWWGVYLKADGVLELAGDLIGRAGGALAWPDAVVASRIFLYGHEAFHHIVESFATRLEVTHRLPLYRVGFRGEYNRTAGSDASVEEALASAFAYRKVGAAFRKEPAKRSTILRALQPWMAACPPGYRRAIEFLKKPSFEKAKRAFAEVNHAASLGVPQTPVREIWLSFPHAFSGISRITSRVNYIIHKNSELAQRIQLDGLYLRKRDVVARLKKLVDLRHLRNGPHATFVTKDGKRVQIPNHPGDIAPGTLSSIIKLKFQRRIGL